MRKTIIMIIALSLLLVFAGCDTSNNIENSSNVVNSGVIQTNGSESVEYKTFEEKLKSCTDVVRAKYVEAKSYDGYIEYEFEVTERYLGEDIGKTIYVYSNNYLVSVIDKGINYYKSDISYTKDEEYLLILTRHVSVFADYDKYTSSGNIFIPMNNLAESKMYGESLDKHSQKSLSIEKTTVDQLLDYICQETKDNTKLYSGKDYIKSTDVKDIVAGSSYIVQVQIGEETFLVGSKTNNTYKCKIIDIIKGDLLVEKNIEITFIIDTVEIGKEYLVAMEEIERTDKGCFIVSSKNSVYSIELKADIKLFIE